MLKLFPVAGTILLTAIILYSVYRIMWNERRKIADALHRRYDINPVEALIKAGVLDEDDERVQAWRNYCDQPVGDKPEPLFFYESNPGEETDHDIYRRFANEIRHAAHQAPRPAASEPESCQSLSDSGSLILRDVRSHAHIYRDLASPEAHIMPELRARYGVTMRAEVTSKPTPYPADCTCHPDDRPFICQHRKAASECVAAFHEAYPEIAGAWDTAVADEEGDPLPAAMAHQPNIGGEGHPDYQGPHYDSVIGNEKRFIPYDLLRDPIEGAAVFVASDNHTGVVGPMPVNKPDRTLDTHPDRKTDDAN